MNEQRKLTLEITGTVNQLLVTLQNSIDHIKQHNSKNKVTCI